MNYRWFDPSGNNIGATQLSHCIRLNFEKSSPRWRIMGRESRILLVEFFNSLEKIVHSLEVNGMLKTWLKIRAELKIESRSTAQSIDHAQTCTREEKHWNGWPLSQPPRGSSISRRQSVNHLIDGPGSFLHSVTTGGRSPGRPSRVQFWDCTTSDRPHISSGLFPIWVLDSFLIWILIC